MTGLEKFRKYPYVFTEQKPEIQDRKIMYGRYAEGPDQTYQSNSDLSG